MKNQQFQVEKKQFVKSRLQEISNPEMTLEDGEILVKIDKFAYTSNNITYAVAGDMIGYWNFYPVGDDPHEAWGIIPVWGFADVTESKNEAISVGDRFFGYFPPAHYLKMNPTRINEQRFVEGSVHRRELPAVYNGYQRVATNPDYDRSLENERMVLFPLHLTAFFLADRLLEEEYYGAEQILILSASSKTGTGVGYALKEGSGVLKVIGLTSPRNLSRIQPLEIYDTCTTYADIGQIDSVPTAIVDMSGSGKILSELHAHLGDDLKYVLKVGLTHWQDTSSTADLEVLADRSRFFFAPTQIAKRLQEWGTEEYQRRTEEFMKLAATKTKAWMNFRKIDGLAGLQDIHEAVCAGEIPANEGLVVQM